MTLAQIVNLVLTTCGYPQGGDDTTNAFVKLSVNARYSAIWDAFAWRDTEMTATASVGLGGIIALPDNMSRVVAIRSDGRTFLDPVSVSQLMQTDPEIFTRQGKPTCYREYNDGQSQRIEVFPKPMSEVSLFITGKRTVSQLVNDSDSPALRNIDNALVAFGVHDLLRRQRHPPERLAQVLQEANALLTEAQNLETQQANQPRQIKKLSVNGNTLAELADQVSLIVDRWAPQDLIAIKNFLRSNCSMIYDLCNWNEATVCAKVNTDGAQIVLPSYFDRVIAVRVDPNLGMLDVVEPSLVFGITPQIFEQTGVSYGFSYLTSVGVTTLPPTLELLEFSSTDISDDGNVFLMGESQGVVVSENIELNGQNVVHSENRYDTPLTISKLPTQGRLRVVGATSGTVLLTLMPDETEQKHMRIWLHAKPQVAQVALILGKRTMTPFAQDEDTPPLRDMAAALIAGAAADMFAKIGNAAASQDQRQQAQDAIKTMTELETLQGAFGARIIPYVEPDSYCYSGLTLTRLGWIG